MWHLWQMWRPLRSTSREPDRSGKDPARMSDPTDLTFSCAHCLHPIAPGAGSLSLDPAALAAAVEVPTQRSAAPTLARWRAQHDACAAGPGAHPIPVENVPTLGDALWETIRLTAEPWARHTDWEAFIRQAAQRTPRPDQGAP